jgi:hypothetical protein
MVETENDKQDEITLLLDKMLDSANRLVALAKEKQSNAESVIYVDDDGNDASITVYDYRTMQMTSSTTFDKLAQELYGDPSYGTLIAYYNKIQNEHEVEAGTTLKIPVLTEAESTANRIYAVPEMQDNYGRDISIGDGGEFEVANGDFAIVSGKENLWQALCGRLTTASDKRIRLGAYGIRASIGDPLAIDSYLMSSIEQTVREDPRIDRIEEIQFEGKGDALSISVTYTDINGSRGNYKGEI